MITLSKLPRFMEFLHQHYLKYYSLYNGRLVELFPSSEATEDSLSIAEDNVSSEADDDQLYELWKEFR